jgi:hypothetical protein
MGKVKKRVQHLRKIAQIPKKKTFKKGKSPFSQENSLIKWNEEFYETEHQEEYEESSVESNSDESDLIEWSGEASEATIELLYERLNDNMQKLPKSNRPNIYLKKSRTTLYRNKKKGEKNAKENGSTMLDFFHSEKDDYDSDVEKYDVAIEELEETLKTGKKITPDYKLRLKSVQFYYKLLKKGKPKITASEIVADVLDRGQWFAKCVRSWGKAYFITNQIPRSNRGQHFCKSSFLYDENVEAKIISYLRSNKFNVTVSCLSKFIEDEIIPSLGIDRRAKIE